MRTILLLGLLSVSPALAQTAFAQTWSNTYPTAGEDVLWKAIEDTDGTLIVSGYSSTEGSLLSRLRPDGKVIWSRSLPSSALLRDHALAANGDILACGHHIGGALVLRIDPSGTILWQSQLPWEYWGAEDSIAHTFTAITEAANGDILLAGQSVFDPCGDVSLEYFRLDSSGNKIWGFHGDVGWLTDVSELPDGSIAYVGASHWGGVIYLKVGSDGLALSERILNPQGGSRGRVSLAPDGNLFVVPGCFTCYYFTYWNEVDLDGAYDPQEPFEVTKVDPDGNVLWRRGYGAAPDLAIDVVATPDGGALVLGETRALGGDKDLRLTRIDAQGAVVWQRAYGGTGHENATGVTALADGGFLVTGRTDSRTSTGMDGLLMRVSSSGEIAGCTTTMTWRTEQLLVDGSTVIAPPEWTNKNDLERTDLDPAPAGLLPDEVCLGMPGIGSVYCSPAAANSSGVAAEIHTVGSTLLVDENVTLVTTGAPAATFGYFLAGTGNSLVAPPGSQGILCLGGSSIHRYAKLVQTTDADGSMSIAIDVNKVPGHGAIQAGETWNFQAWFRDVNPTPTSNLTDATAVMFF